MSMTKHQSTPIHTGFANVDRILNSNLINRATLAAHMYPTNKGAKQYLHKKLNRIERQSFGPADRDKLIQVITNELL